MTKNTNKKKINSRSITATTTASDSQVGVVVGKSTGEKQPWGNRGKERLCKIGLPVMTTELNKVIEPRLKNSTFSKNRLPAIEMPPEDVILLSLVKLISTTLGLLDRVKFP